jgi:hypothetical protein
MGRALVWNLPVCVFGGLAFYYASTTMGGLAVGAMITAANILGYIEGRTRGGRRY